MMRIDPSRAVGAYAAVMTATVAWLVLGGAAATGERHFGTISVERIDVREPDGTLRLAISNHARMPGIVIGKTEYPHPNRPEAGMIFYNDQGVENGGLVFDGGLKNGVPTNSGSLTFDRWRQDQTIQMTSTETGPKREAAVIVNDRPDGPLDFAGAQTILKMPLGPLREAAFRMANFETTQRAYLGRKPDGASQLLLRDGAGKARLRLSVAADGTSGIDFLDDSGRVTRHFP